MSVFGGGTDPQGAPFGDSYRTGPASEAPSARARTRVRLQVGELALRRSDPAMRRRLAHDLQERWRERRHGRLEILPGRNGLETLLVGGEVLVTTQTWADRGARSYLLRRGLTEVELGCPDLEGRLVRLVARDDVAVQTLDDTVSELRVRGHAASLTHVTPLSPVMKGLGGPTEAPSLGAFDAYPTHGCAQGDPARVAVIDTGIDAATRTDGWLADVERREHDDPSTHGWDANVDPLDSDPHDGLLDFSDGHGTFVAGIVAQVAPRASIAVHRALGDGGMGSELEVACALVRAVKDGAQVVNLSLGCQTRYDQPSLAIAAALDEVGRIGRERGEEPLVVAAAGNYGDTIPTWPAAFRSVVAVGALTADLRPTSWSSRGFWVDCSTVGEGVLSTFVEGTESYEFTADPDSFGPDAFARWSGTSFAAPQITGAVARTMQQHGLPPRRAFAELMASGRAVPDFGQALSILPGL